MKSSSIRKLNLLLTVTILLGATEVLHADLGSNNPTGVAGEFNGTVTTGCAYDPYTGNAHRSITDIVVPGAVGTYPLSFTRKFNTRVPSGVNTPFLTPFGMPGLASLLSVGDGNDISAFRLHIYWGTIRIHRELPGWTRCHF